MHQSVVDAFVRFSSPLEGVAKNPYLDVKGLLTIGIGCLIDPPETATALPWVFADGSHAPATEALAQLRVLKSQQGLKNYRFDSSAVLNATTIRLTDEGVIAVVRDRLLAGEPLMRKAFPAWDTWPSDAQLFACSMGWAIGFGWPNIFGNCAQLLRGDAPQFGLAATGNPATCDIKSAGNAGVIPRNSQNRLLLTNAQVVLDRDLPRDVLYWPSSPIFTTEPAGSQGVA